MSRTRRPRSPSSPDAPGCPLAPSAGELAEAAPSLDLPPPLTISRYALRVVEEPPPDVSTPTVPVVRPAQAAWLFWNLAFDGEPREVLAVLFRDASRRVFGYHIAYTGTLHRVQAEPRQILATALLVNAASIIVAHNHPSGDLRPSDEDIAFTRRLAAACEAVGVALVDHLIVVRGVGQPRWRPLSLTPQW
jgi:DNA repair protein RadC